MCDWHLPRSLPSHWGPGDKVYPLGLRFGPGSLCPALCPVPPQSSLNRKRRSFGGDPWLVVPREAGHMDRCSILAPGDGSSSKSGRYRVVEQRAPWTELMALLSRGPRLLGG